MAKIKKIGFKDTFNIKKLISCVCSDNILNYRRLFWISVPTTYLQNLFYSVHLRKLEETYVVSDNNGNLKGLITVQAQQGNPYKWQIKRLFLAPNSHEEGKQLIEYIIAKFGARGVDTFIVSVNDSNNELIDLFIKGCGFRLCATESLWDVNITDFLFDNINDKNFAVFKDSDSKKVNDLYNENLISLYKYSMQKEKEEFNEKFSQGFNSTTEFKYIYEDFKTKELQAYIKIKTLDNKNYFLDTIIPTQYTYLYPMIIAFAVRKILKRNKFFKLYIKNKKYLQSGEAIENYCKENHFQLLQNNAILVRDFFKTVKEESRSFNEAVILNGFEV